MKSHFLMAACLCAASAALAAPVEYRTPHVVTTTAPVDVTFDGAHFINKGLQGMARLSAATRDFRGDTFGGFSGLDFVPGSWRKTASGYAGTLVGLPDRGPNGVGKIDFSDYPGRLIPFTVTFTPYIGAADLPANESSQHQITLTASGGTLLTDFNGQATTGFDANGSITQHGVQLPSPASGPAAGRLSLDSEALRFLKDGSFYVGDEYGAYVYSFDAGGKLQGVIVPPPAIVPKDAKGVTQFTSRTGAVTGRRANQGFEGVGVTPDGSRLVALLQSATLQDSGDKQVTRANTRLLIYDIAKERTPKQPIASYVLQLPVYTQAGDGGAPDRTAAQSELLALNERQFLVLSRDGNGLGQESRNPVFKSVLLVDTAGATNIAGTAYDTTTTPIAPGGTLRDDITPVHTVELINMLNSAELKKFGENLDNAHHTRLTIGEKWEGMALASALDPAFPDDYFLFAGNDTDFLSSTCTVGGQGCSQPVDSDATLLVYRVTLPTYGR